MQLAVATKLYPSYTSGFMKPLPEVDLAGNPQLAQFGAQRLSPCSSMFSNAKSVSLATESQSSQTETIYEQRIQLRSIDTW